MSIKRQDMRDHPCWRETGKELSHRSGGFGGTCERCGTSLIEGDVNKGVEGPIKWEPVSAPKPFAPWSLERAVYDAIVATGAPLHNGWKEQLATDISAALADQFSGAG